MTAEQSLAGAMGCASWRSHCRLREYASLAGVASVIRGSDPLRIENAGVWDLNEVGVTDTVVAAIWRFGPVAAAHAISSRAEARHLGADIAIVHQRTSRILLYQAKLAAHKDGVFRLKSAVTRQQLALLRRRRVEIGGTRYQVTGRLALYQQDLTPFLGHCPFPFLPDPWRRTWRSAPVPFPAGHGGDWGPAPETGPEYYKMFLADYACSPGGILAAFVPGGHDRVTAVDAASTWPWEFDAYQWLGHEAPEGSRDDPGAGPGFGGAAPDFEPYLPAGAPLAPAPAAGIADELAEQLRLPATTILYVIALP